MCYHDYGCLVGEVEFCGKVFPALGHFIAIGLGRLALGGGDLPDFLAVFIQAGEKENLLAEAATGPGDGVGDDVFVRVAQVRLAVDVIDGGRDVEAFGHSGCSVAQGAVVGNGLGFSIFDF